MSGMTFLHPTRLVLLLLAPLAYVAWRRWPPPLSRGHSRLSLVLRTVMVVALVLALSGLRFTSPPKHRAVVAVVDLSDSAAGSEEAAARAVRAMASAKPHDDLLGIVTFGRDAHVELPPTRTPNFDGFQTRPDGSYSDLAGALRLAANLVPDGYGRQVLLVSDGRQNLGDAATTVADLRSQSVRVDVLALGAPSQAEALLVGLEAPSQLRAGQSLRVKARLRSTAPAAGKLSLQIDGRDSASRPVQLPVGDSSEAFDLPPLDPGTHRLRAVLDAEPDGHSQNNVFEAVVRVLERPSVLVAEAVRGGSANVVASLQAAGMRADVRRAEELPTDPSALAGYDSTVLVDVPADAVPPAAQQALATSVRQLGRGLVAIGGTSSYGPGGWKDTPLEEAMPIRMDIPNRRQKPTIAVAVVLETTEGPTDAAALGAVEGVVDQLAPDDEITVVGMQNSTTQYIVPLTLAADKEGIKQQVRRAELGDPSGYGEAMQMGFDAVAKSLAATKHMIIIGDGDGTSDIGRYETLLSAARNVTVSAVGIDLDRSAQFMAHMRDLARLGGGRFYLSEDAASAPQILLKASRDTLKPWFENQPFFPKVTSAGDLLSGVPLDAFPELGGYVVTTPKAAGEMALSSPSGDPVLANWQYGLGRSVAWTSDSRGRWTSGFLGSPVSAALFARMVAWTLPGPPTEGLTIQALPAGDGLDVSLTREGTATDEGSDVVLDTVGPGADRAAVPLRSVGPNRWEGRTRAGNVGTYVLHASLRKGGVAVGQTELTVPVPYSPEYLEAGRDDGFLRLLARRGGGVVSRPGRLWSHSLPPLRVSADFFWPLLLLAVLLWPIDVAVRRVTLTARQALSVLGSVAHLRRPTEIEVTTPPALSDLKERLADRRRRVPGGDEPVPVPPEAPVP